MCSWAFTGGVELWEGENLGGCLVWSRILWQCLARLPQLGHRIDDLEGFSGSSSAQFQEIARGCLARTGGENFRNAMSWKNPSSRSESGR